MPRFERSGNGGSRSRFQSKGGRKSFTDRPTRGGDRDNRKRDGGRREVELTEVICSSCGVKCEVPFKPTSSKPVYCKNCFTNKDQGTNNRSSGKSHDEIIEKLDKILKILSDR